MDRIKIIAFILSSVMAACGGILAGSRLYAVNQSSGSGTIWSALLGALVIGSITNGIY